MRRGGAAALLLLSGLGLASCGAPPAQGGTGASAASPPPLAGRAEPHAAKPELDVSPSGLQHQDLVVGMGAQPKPGDRLAVHYEGWLADGTKFDSSRDRGEPFVFTLKAQPFPEVIAGWDEGIATMRVGGKRRLVVPPALAYGAEGAAGVIPPNATLTFDVELLEIR